MLWSAAALWGPASIGFFSDCSHCREVWPSMVAVAPGYLPALVVFRSVAGNNLPDGAEWVAALVLTLGLWAAMAFFGRARLAGIVLLVLGSVFSLMSTGGLVAAMRA